MLQSNTIIKLWSSHLSVVGNLWWESTVNNFTPVAMCGILPPTYAQWWVVVNHIGSITRHYAPLQSLTMHSSNYLIMPHLTFFFIHLHDVGCEKLFGHHGQTFNSLLSLFMHFNNYLTMTAVNNIPFPVWLSTFQGHKSLMYYNFGQILFLWLCYTRLPEFNSSI